MCVCLCLFVLHHAYAVPTNTRRGRLSPWNWSSKQLWATWCGWVLENKPGSSARVASALHHWAVSLTLHRPLDLYLYLPFGAQNSLLVSADWMRNPNFDIQSQVTTQSARLCSSGTYLTWLSGCVAQLVRFLPDMHKVFGSVPGTPDPIKLATMIVPTCKPSI